VLVRAMRPPVPLTIVLAAAFAAPAPADGVLQVPAAMAGAALASTLGWTTTVEPAPYRVVIGDSDDARALGFVPTDRTVRVASLREARAPELEVFWQQPLELPVFSLPPGAIVLTTEKRTAAPLAAGLRGDAGAVLWLATAPGERGYERFPFWLHALADLGLEPPFRNARTWVFFDPAYRARVDPQLLARRWRQAGVS